MRKLEIFWELPKCDRDMKWANTVGIMALIGLSDRTATNLQFVGKKTPQYLWSVRKHNKTRYACNPLWSWRIFMELSQKKYSYSTESELLHFDGKTIFFFLIGASCKISFIEGIMLIFLRVWETLALYNF